jgi:hypothetical protein
MKLKVNKILNEDDFNLYLKIVELFEIINPFYKISGSSIFEFTNEDLRYFTLVNENEEVLILMPFFLRKIPYTNKDETYFDVISTYGYSGPLFNDRLSRGYLILFWEAVDVWYKDNHVVSEFIRFSLNHNFQFYSGILIPTLTNVKGKLVEQNEQWNGFKAKVRNNYRKCLEYNLKVKFLYKSITDEDIEIYYEIYIKTMNRLAADCEYLYSLDYFKNIVKLSNKNFVVVLVYKDEIAISAELILIAGDTLYSYLGGTLSEYFNYRPNDFLKIEVMKWAKKHNYEYYILGGGRSDNDSLYQYKKSFFPKDQDIIYYTGRKVVNKKVYDNLDKIMNTNVVLDGSEDKIDNVKSSYFPSYRRLGNNL